MYEVYNCRTNRVVKRCRDIKEAHRVAQNYDSAYEWVDGSKFDYRELNEGDNREYKQREQAKRVRRRGGRLKPVERFRFAR